MNDQKVPFLQSFIKSQLGSSLATLFDFSSLYILTEWAGIYYVVSAAMASSVGAVVGFLVLRHWAFRRTDKTWFYQAIKYGVASLIILVLNVVGIYCFTEFLNFQYMVSKLFIAFIIGIFVSFPLFRYYVYS